MTANSRRWACSCRSAGKERRSLQVRMDPNKVKGTLVQIPSAEWWKKDVCVGRRPVGAIQFRALDRRPRLGRAAMSHRDPRRRHHDLPARATSLLRCLPRHLGRSAWKCRGVAYHDVSVVGRGVCGAIPRLGGYGRADTVEFLDEVCVRQPAGKEAVTLPGPWGLG